MTLGLDGTPVEAQAFWTPDPRRVGADDECDRAILEGLRPADVAHERLVVVPPEMQYDDECEPDESQMLYADFASAPLQPLRLHPELESRAVVLTPGPGERDRSSTAHAAGAAPPASSSSSVIEDESGSDVDEDAYEHPVMARSDDLAPGDLVCVDEASDAWGVVESAEPDLTNPDSWCVCWRSDEAGDDFDVMVVSATQMLRARRQPRL